MKILLVCNAGMSTSILVREMEKAAKEQQLELEVTAMGFTQAEKVLLDWDIVMLGPQVRHQLTGLQKAAIRIIIRILLITIYMGKSY